MRGGSVRHVNVAEFAGLNDDPFTDQCISWISVDLGSEALQVVSFQDAPSIKPSF